MLLLHYLAKKRLDDKDFIEELENTIEQARHHTLQWQTFNN